MRHCAITSAGAADPALCAQLPSYSEGTTLREHYGLGVPPNQFHVPEAARTELARA